MAARSLASLTISFGLVAIPVKLYSATQSSAAVSFNLLHRGCGSRLKQQYVCLREGVVVERDQMDKGYEFAKDQYVVFTPDELKALEETATNAVDISEFVPLEAVDPVYFDRAYYLAPDKGGGKPYSLLVRALHDTGQCAIGRWAARGKQTIVMLRPAGDALVMQQLLYAEEVRPLAQLDVVPADVRENELRLAEQLIEQNAADRFDPSGYTDEVRARIDAAIEKKLAGQEITTAEPAVAGGAQIIDLMDALRASLERSGSAAKRNEAPPHKPARRAAQPLQDKPQEKKAARRKPG